MHVNVMEISFLSRKFHLYHGHFISIMEISFSGMEISFSFMKMSISRMETSFSSKEILFSGHNFFCMHKTIRAGHPVTAMFGKH